MRAFSFDPRDGGEELAAYGSSGVLFSVLARSTGGTQLACLRLQPGGAVGRHPAPVPQLFAVIEGSGWVRADGGKVPIGAGQAALWDAGEEHESGAGRDGMTVLVLEGEGVRGAAQATRTG